MNTIYLQTFSWITDALGIRGNNSYTFEKKVEAGTTLLTVFTDLARDYPEFREKVYNPETGKLSRIRSYYLLTRDWPSLIRLNHLHSMIKMTISLVPVIIGG